MISDSSRLLWIKRITCIGFAVGMWVTEPLWLTQRFYPLTPVSKSIPIVGAPFDRFLFLFTLLMLIAVALLRTTRTCLAALLLVLSYFALSDQSRWHPAFYWYSFILLSVFIAELNSGATRAHSSLQACRVLFIATYFWSGLQKINVTFYYNLFPWMLSAFIPSPQTHPFFSKLPFAIPIIEVSIGLLLLLPRFRVIGIALAVGMHLTILTLLGPLGHAVNSNVWPLNATAIALVITLFIDTLEVSAESVLKPRSLIHVFAQMLFFLMPILTFFDCWDAYAGFSLYSGSQRAGYIQLTKEAAAALPKRFTSYIDEHEQLHITKWAVAEVGTPEYAEPRIYRSLLSYICALIPSDSTDVELVIMSKPSRITGARQVDERIRCEAR